MANKIVLQATQSFIDLRATAEKRIHEIICEKISEFIEMEDYNWTTTVVAAQPSAYLQDLANYLKVVGSSSLASLPPTLIPTIFRESFEFFSKKLMEYFVGPAIKKISFPFLTQISLDLKFLEALIKKEYPYLQEEEIFSEMSQVRYYSNFVVGFIYSVGRIRSFPGSHCSRQKILQVSDANYNPGDGKVSHGLESNIYRFYEEVSFFSSMSSEQRNRSKKIETFISQLKMKQSGGK